MKKCTKHFLSRIGLFSGIDLLRRTPEVISWVGNGCRGTPPPPVKRMVIQCYLKDYQLKNFIETGTHQGDTLAHVAYDKSVKAVSIELADDYYGVAAKRFAKYRNILLLHGDSGKLMPQVVSGLQSPALFWLDAHYSGGATAKGDTETPISAELQAVLDSTIPGHVILVDDVRCFDGSNDYPHLDEFMAFIRKDGRYHLEVSADILRLTPPKPSCL